MASSTVTLPGDFEITSLQEDKALLPGEDFNFIWSTSEGAERYCVELRVRFGYIDTAGSSGFFDLDTIFYTTDTSHIIPGSRMFSAEVDSVSDGYGYIYVYSENGTRLGNSSEGNIKGINNSEETI